MRASEVQTGVGTIRRLRVSEWAFFDHDNDLAGPPELGEGDLSAGSERVGGTFGNQCAENNFVGRRRRTCDAFDYDAAYERYC